MQSNVWREGSQSETSSSFAQNLYSQNVQEQALNQFSGYNPLTHYPPQYPIQGHHPYNPNLPHHPPPIFHHQPPPLFHHHSAPQPDILETLAQLSAGQKELFASLNNINSRINTQQQVNAPVASVDQLTEGLNGINLNRHPPPHTDHLRPTFQPTHAAPTLLKPSYIPTTTLPSRISSPSEGAYARDRDRKLVIREARIRENIRFNGDGKLLRQFLLDIYDVMDQHTFDFTSDKQRINWIASHFTSTISDTTPAQSWFSALLMENAYVHGITDQYVNMKSLDYVIDPLVFSR